MIKIAVICLLSFFLFTIQGCKKLDRDNLLDDYKNENTLDGVNLSISKFEITADDNNDKIANKGETISLKLYLKNRGTKRANEVKASISCNNTFFSSLSPTTELSYPYNSHSYNYTYNGNFSNFLKPNQESDFGGSGSKTNTLNFKISNSAPIGTVLTFDVTITDKDNHKWTDVFTITVGSTNANIEFSRYEITSDNNNDQIINKGEVIRLNIYLKNTGASQANKVTATISCSNNYVSNLIPTTASTYYYSSGADYLSPGKESTFGGFPTLTNTLSFNVSNTIPDGTILTFDLAIKDEDGNTWTDNFTVTVGSIITNSKIIKFSKYEIISDNNNDKIVNKGETINLKVYLKNTGTSQVNSVTAKITSLNNYVSNLTPTTALNYDYNYITHLNAGQESSAGGFPYSNSLSFKVSNTTPNGTVLTFNIAIIDELGNTWTDSFTLTVKPTDANIGFSRFEISSDNNSNKIANKGELISLKVYLKNNGTSQANSVTATISCSNSYVSNLSPGIALNYDEYYVDNLLAGHESTPGGYPNYSNTLSFNVSNSTPTGTILTFSISIVDESNNTWQDSFTITVN
jgi:hypothetical protein